MKRTSFQESSRPWAVYPAPGGHAAQADAVFDDVEQLAVGLVLRFFGAHVGRLGVHSLPHGNLAAAIVGVTGGAVIGPVLTRFGENFGGGGYRILLLSGTGGESEILRDTGGEVFECGRTRAGAQAVRDGLEIDRRPRLRAGWRG